MYRPVASDQHDDADSQLTQQEVDAIEDEALQELSTLKSAAYSPTTIIVGLSIFALSLCWNIVNLVTFVFTPAASPAILSTIGGASAELYCLNGLYRKGEWTPAVKWYPYYTASANALGWCDESSDPNFWQWNETQRANHALPPAKSLLNTSQMFVRSALKWQWSTSSCTLEPFPNPAEFCRALQGHSILFVGDSISLQQFQSLDMLLGAPNEWPQPDTTIKSSICQQHLNQTGESDADVSIGFVRNDFLSDVQEPRPSVTPSGRQDREFPWRHLVTSSTILVLNTGVHVVPPEAYARQLNETFSWIRNQYPLATLIWRPSIAGQRLSYDVERAAAFSATL